MPESTPATAQATSLPYTESFDELSFEEAERINPIASFVDIDPSSLDLLFNDVRSYDKDKNIGELFNFVKRFPRLSIYNAMLVYLQMPGAKYVATQKVWKKNFNRTIKFGSRPLVVLRPFGPVDFVYEVSDTVGNDELPEEVTNPFAIKSHFILNKNLFVQMTKNLENYDIYYREEDYGTQLAGQIASTITEIEVKDGKYIKNARFDIVVNSNHDIPIKLVTLLHELGHLFCGHVGSYKNNSWPDRKKLSVNSKEFEAESVAWLICERHKINNPSAAYLSGYLDGGKNMPFVSVDMILKVAGKIESLLIPKSLREDSFS